MSFYDALREHEIREIFRFWMQRRNAGDVPAWHAITPSEIRPQLLPYLFLFVREDDGRFRCKLAGTELCHAVGFNQTGRYLDALLQPRAARQHAALFQHVLDTGRPLYYSGLEATRPGELRHCTRILLPLASSGQAVDLVFGMARFGPLKSPDPERDRALPPTIVYAAERDLEMPERCAPTDVGETTA